VERGIAVGIAKIDVNAEETYWHADAVVAGDYVFTSYQAGVYDDDGRLLDTVEGQTEQAIKNLAGTLAKAGATLEDVVKVTLLVRKVDEFQPAIMAYGRFFGEICPARMTIVSAFLGEDHLVQLDAIAYKPQASG
jgi:2-iminobutanoate/2-iminopropanoate deaminase